MNSLTYLSRQFDVLASARTPPSTPSAEHPPPSYHLSQPHHPRQPLHRTLSFLYPPSRSTPRRTYSSPAFRLHTPPSSSSPASSSASSAASASSSTSSPSTTQPPPIPEPLPVPQRSKPRHQLDTVINQVFFIRLFLLVWNKVNSTWSALLDQFNIHVWPRRHTVPLPVPVPVSLASVISEKGKEKEIQIVQEVAVASPYDDPKLESQPASRASTSSPEGSPAPPSRASTPVIHGRKAHFGLKTLVLDLDETLIHSTSRPNPSLASSGSGFFGLGLIGRGNKSPGHTVEVILGGKRTQYHVYKRPFVDFFLRTVSGWYTLVIFTASMKEYADPVIDWLDAGRGILVQRLFRDVSSHGT
ncbi:hypothetical protein D9756_000672 [Leucocoprinus leucothites]|uniref:Mitochondrial import inner membrane translocase subunit TIM50 n=1 Tax=Leucocoprinus leucothites TaxID=201217 RepID=A0A8H5GE64_9AGAR|nr:hypothetical protein D9756_000672 [Leucoagaricus leucothites]